LTFKPVESLGLHFSGGYHRDWYGQPGALFDGNIRSDGRKGSRFPDSKAKTEDGYFTAEPRVAFEAGENDLSFVMPITYRLRRSDSRDVGFAVYETNHHIASLDIRPKGEISSSFFDGNLTNKIVFGLDYLGVKDNVLSGDVAFTKSQINMKKDTAALYVSENVLAFDRFTANCGIRGEWAEYSFDQRMPAASLDEKSLKDIAFDAGAGYKYNERSQVYAQYARSYRLPATDEFFQSAYETFDWLTWSVTVFPATLNFDLKQQVANNYDIGIKDNTF
jgi:outer membrane receptor protein involved in Fe transport